MRVSGGGYWGSLAPPGTTARHWPPWRSWTPPAIDEPALPASLPPVSDFRRQCYGQGRRIVRFLRLVDVAADGGRPDRGFGVADGNAGIRSRPRRGPLSAAGRALRPYPDGERLSAGFLSADAERPAGPGEIPSALSPRRAPE